jgi:diguanylate cyclase (GGDEF)-like protein
LLAEVRQGDLVARLGGDEFGVLLWDADPATADTVAERLRVTCRAPIEVAGTQVSVGISVGVAHDDALGERTVERADEALYAEKRRIRRVE